jgi:CheY-like chemotaxis protein/DNA-binding XRE family transcriptional regulator
MEYSTALREFLAEFGKFVREERKKLGISQEELAERSGLHRTYITDVERGVRNMTFESALKLTGSLDLSFQDFFAEFRRWNDARVSTASASIPETSPADILIVEDDPKDAELTIVGLQRNALVNRIAIASTGRDALQLLHGRRDDMNVKDTISPRVVLLDLRLPDIDGIEVLRRIRSHQRTRTLPVVILTSSRSDLDFHESVSVGVSGYLTKPIDWVEFSLMMPKFGFRWLLLDGRHSFKTDAVAPSPAHPAAP